MNSGVGIAWDEHFSTIMTPLRATIMTPLRGSFITRL